MRQQARKFRNVFDKDYPQPEHIEATNNSLTFDEDLNNTKNMVRRTNLEYDNIRPVFINLEVPKK
ncbi:hypothetical protein FACS189472_16620 [Alphaproteobacteria bacterium]|nr:hypothetical protein FACS189472_16620 [Alphaproteobacteria bacterium]